MFSEKHTAVLMKPMRVCKDCLDDVKSDLSPSRLSKHDSEVLKWKCQGRNCYSPAEYKVSADDYETARKKGKVFETKCARFLDQVN